MLAGADVGAHILGFLRTAELGRLLQAGRALHALLLHRGLQHAWEGVLAADLACYGIPPGAAAGGWAAGRGLVRPPAVRWCRRHARAVPPEARMRRSEEEEEGEGEEEGEEEGEGEELLPDDDPLSPPRAFHVVDVRVERQRGEAWDPEGGPEGTGAIYRFGGCFRLLDATEEWTPANGWRTLRIRGR